MSKHYSITSDCNILCKQKYLFYSRLNSLRNYFTSTQVPSEDSSRYSTQNNSCLRIEITQYNFPTLYQKFVSSCAVR